MTRFLDKKLIKNINTYFYPALCAMTMNLVFSLIDSMIVGRISVDSLAAIGVANRINYVMIGVLGTVSMAYHILLGQNMKKRKLNINTLFSTAIRECNLFCVKSLD